MKHTEYFAVKDLLVFVTIFWQGCNDCLLTWSLVPTRRYSASLWYMTTDHEESSGSTHHHAGCRTTTNGGLLITIQFPGNWTFVCVNTALLIRPYQNIIPLLCYVLPSATNKHHDYRIVTSEFRNNVSQMYSIPNQTGLGAPREWSLSGIIHIKRKVWQANDTPIYTVAHR